MRLVVTIPNCIDEFIHEPLQRHIRHRQVWVGLSDRVTRCLNQMGLTQAHTTVKVKRVVSPAGHLGDRFGRGVSESVAGTNNKALERVLGI